MNFKMYKPLFKSFKSIIISGVVNFFSLFNSLKVRGG